MMCAQKYTSLLDWEGEEHNETIRVLFDISCYQMYRVTALNVTRIWINRLFGPAQTVWQFLPFLVTFHAVTRYVLGDMEYKKLEGGREWIDATLTVWFICLTTLFLSQHGSLRQ